MLRALIITDIQNDFLPGGALAVPRGDEVIPIINRLQALYDVVLATQDWHPADHVSFASNHAGRLVGDEIEIDGIRQMLWPVHCVQGTWGAEFAPGLDRQRIERVFHKALDPNIDSYSTFFDNGHRRATGLGDYLAGRGASEVHLCGLALDYCIRYSALDSRMLGFDTTVIVDACRGIEAHVGDVQAALDQMRDAGVRLASSRELVAAVR
jgi:nicotinamidase/pyrazinamidase